MVIYDKDKKILIIPAGGSGGSGIIPTSGDCEQAIEQARTEGYNSGKAAQKAVDDAKITPTLTVIENGQYTANYGYKKVIVDVPTSGDCSEAIAIAYQSGYTEGYNQGQEDCPECSGSTDCSSAITEAYQSGYTNGYSSGYSQGQADCPICPPCPPCDCTEAYESGITAGVAIGFQRGFEAGKAEGYSDGYGDGYREGEASVHKGVQGTVTTSIDTLLVEVLNTLDCEGNWQSWYVDLDGVTVSWGTPLTSQTQHTVAIHTQARTDVVALNTHLWDSVKIY